MSAQHDNNKRIAKNTLLLYIRLGVVLLINFYTSRVILKYLGVQDFGIYNVVGGITALMGVLNSAMTVSTQRYLSFEMGTKSTNRLQKVFCITLTIYIILSVLFFILCETVGLWFLNTHLIIPEHRMSAANWVFQFSIFSIINSLLTNPYNASIIAHECMNIFAYVSMLENILKLLIVFCLPLIPLDRLVVYGALYLLVSFLITILYRLYCIRKFDECHFQFYYDKGMYREILSYSGWNLFGSLSGIAQGQGLNILLNMFFNPVVCAANGIATQINGAITMFFSNFYVAVRPQITKYYAQNELENMFSLVFRSSRFSYYLILIVALPVLLETPFLVSLWLGQLPEYVVDFTRLTIIISAITAMSSPIMTMVHATGKIKVYQLVVGLCQILILPISYFFLLGGCAPNTVFEVSLVMVIVAFFVRLYIVRSLISSFSIPYYFKSVVLSVAFVTFLSMVAPCCIYYTLEHSLTSALIICISSLISVILSIWLVGMSNGERQYVKSLINSRILRK